jgi:SAM-dependent methyltransferase
VAAGNGESFQARQRREREFYDQFVQRHCGWVSFKSVTSARRWPWNPYWAIHDWTARWLTRPDMRLLDFGCGPGEFSLRYARQGYRVAGFDISPGNIATALNLAAKYGLTDRTMFSVQAGERLAFPDASFDVIGGVDILHHVTIAPAIAECLRVLKPGGRAIFLEPIEVPVFDRLRRSRVGKTLFPMTVSLDRHVTEDERKLTPAELEHIRQATVGFEADRFLLLARLDRFHPLARWTHWSILERIDSALFTVAPPLRAFGGKVLIRFRKPA